MVKMHVRHEQTIAWLHRTFPGSRVYGPYRNQGREFMMWVAQGQVLYDVIVPLVGRHLDSVDDHVKGRFLRMCERRGLFWYPGREFGTLDLRESQSSPCIGPEEGNRGECFTTNLRSKLTMNG